MQTKSKPRSDAECRQKASCVQARNGCKGKPRSGVTECERQAVDNAFLYVTRWSDNANNMTKEKEGSYGK